MTQLDTFFSSSIVGTGFISREVLLLARVLLVPPLFFITLRRLVKSLNTLDIVCLAIAEGLLFYCALRSETLLTLDYFWIALLIFSVVSINSYVNGEIPSNSFKLERLHCRIVSAVAILVFLFTAASNISFWVFHLSNLLVNPNTACAISGLYLVFLTSLVKEKTLPNKSKPFLLICWSLIFLSTLLSFSRVSIVWICISLLIILPKWRSASFIKWIFTSILALFCFLSITTNVVLLTGNAEPFINLLQNQDVEWRVKGDTGSDFQRLRYYNVVMNYLKNDEILTGSGFGIRGYREQLAIGEDVHNAFLTTLSDSGYLGTYTVIFVCCFWSFLRFFLSGQRSDFQLSLFLSSVFSSATFFPAPIYGSQYFSLAIIYCFMFLKSGSNDEQKNHSAIDYEEENSVKQNL